MVIGLSSCQNRQWSLCFLVEDDRTHEAGDMAGRVGTFRPASEKLASLVMIFVMLPDLLYQVYVV